MNTFNGIPIIESVYAVQDGAPVTVAVPRSWRDRWLSKDFSGPLWKRPWNPFVATRDETQIQQVPACYIVKMPGGQTLVAHPAIVAYLKRFSFL